MPLGISYIASALHRENIDVVILDSLIEGWDNATELDKHNIQYGLTPVEIAERALSLSPDLIGISCMFSIQAVSTSDIAREIKQRLPYVTICTGGAHPSAVPEDIVMDGHIDFVILGEGESTIVKLVHALKGKTLLENIDGICYRKKDGQVVLKPKTNYIDDLDNIPLPAFDLLPLERYFKINKPHGTVTKNKRIVPIITSRGCPAKCVFCSIRPVWGRQYRARSPKSVVDEIEMLVNRYSVQEVHIEDDNLTFDKERAGEICDLIIERHIKIVLTAPNGLAIWALDEPLLIKLKQAGFCRLTLAIESGSQKTLSEIIHKPLKIESVLEVISTANRIGFDIDLFFVVGFPGETPEEMQKTFNLGRQLDVSNVKYFIATPYVGTDLLDIAYRDNLIPPSFDPTYIGINVVQGSITTEHFTPEDLERKVLKETMRTQIALFTRHPIRYTFSILKNYVLKDPGATLFFLWKIIKNKFSQ